MNRKPLSDQLWSLVLGLLALSIVLQILHRVVERTWPVLALLFVGLLLCALAVRPPQGSRRY